MVSIVELPDIVAELVGDIIKSLDDVVSDDEEVCTTELLEADTTRLFVKAAEDVVELTRLLDDTSIVEEPVDTTGLIELDAPLSGRLLDVALCTFVFPGTTTVPTVPEPDGCSV